MFINYLKSALRNHIKNKWNSLINILSLAIGIACCILIFVYVSNEFSFDRFHNDTQNIYRLYYQIITNENEVLNSTLHPHAVVAELQHNYPAIMKATAFHRSEALIEYDNKRFKENFALVDSIFLTLFNFPLIAGDPQNSLLSHDKVVITKAIADKFFGNLNNDYSSVIGRVISFYSGTAKKDHIITGVLKPLPRTSSLQFDLLILKENNNFYSRSSNPFGDASIYVLLEKGNHQNEVEASLYSLVDKYYGKSIYDLRAKGALKDTDDCFQLKMQPMKDVYFDTKMPPKYEAQSNKMYSYILFGIGLLILALACINFISLSIGQSFRRTTEVGIRKVLGASKRQIVVQYSVEKIMLIMLSLISGYVIALILLPMFNQLSQKELTISIFSNLGIPLFLAVTLLISSFFAAGIPSLILSRFHPIGIFRAISKFGGRSKVNSLLVIAQFFISIFLLSSSIIMSRQISYMLNKQLGFDKDHVIIIPILKEYSDSYKNKIKNHPEIVNATGCDRNFSNGNSARLFFTQSGKPIEVNIIRIEEDYINTLGITLAEGRNFSKSFPGDKLNSVLINETLVKDFDLQTPVGKIINGHAFTGGMPVAVIGVVKDYHIYSMRAKIPPLILHTTHEINGSWSLLVKIRPENVSNTIKILAEEWRNTVPNREFGYSFLDEDLNRNYQNEERWQKITGISTLFAFIISSLGLLGLASIITNSRTKEIGIRKALGASIPGIIQLLTKEFTKWIVIAFLFSIPISWCVMNKWLLNFAYRIPIEWWTFLIAGLVALAIGLITVSYQSIRAALANPVESLRYE